MSRGKVAFSDASSGIFLRQFPVALSRPVRSEPIRAFSVPADRAAPVARATLVGFVTTTQVARVGPPLLCTYVGKCPCMQAHNSIADKYRESWGGAANQRKSPSRFSIRFVWAKGRSRVPRARTQSLPWVAVPSFPSLSAPNNDDGLSIPSRVIDST